MKKTHQFHPFPWLSFSQIRTILLSWKTTFLLWQFGGDFIKGFIISRIQIEKNMIAAKFYMYHEIVCKLEWDYSTSALLAIFF